MAILSTIDEDLKTALKSKDEAAALELRSLKAALQNAEIEQQKSLTDPDVIKVIAKRVKQHKDSIESFQAGTRPDLVASETAQLQVLGKYLPKQMDEAEVVKVVQETIASTGATSADFGKVMKDVMAKVAGRADGGLVTRLVKENLK